MMSYKAASAHLLTTHAAAVSYSRSLVDLYNDRVFAALLRPSVVCLWRTYCG